MMMLGRKVYTPAALVFPSSKLAFNSSHDYVKQLEGAMQETHVLARSQLKQKLEVRKRDYDLKLHKKSYAVHVGDAIYVLNNSSKKGQSKIAKTMGGSFLGD
ncbi:hypothetical protein DPMN_143481 [Dreissena polymorpha]|uniref:Uncharacterized protein n=1 Tax=Dreissena polymorpha TaxID=45954 RepID=A0A9D4GDN5_DREPO|nr:hypothetical protein DPMN_143481 [Dreissena polymorpha]